MTFNAETSIQIHDFEVVGCAIANVLGKGFKVSDFSVYEYIKFSQKYKYRQW